jgi:hypothetical protein
MSEPTSELRFEGVVDYEGEDWIAWSPSIGGRDVIEEIDQWLGPRSSRPDVRVTLGIEPLASGPLHAWHGFGGTGNDMTPMELPEITVGGTDLFQRLQDLDGREVILIIELAGTPKR